MVRFRFYVHCQTYGGYENTHFAEDEREVQEIIDGWNSKGYRVDLLSIDPITPEEFAEDYIG